MCTADKWESCSATAFFAIRLFVSGRQIPANVLRRCCHKSPDPSSPHTAQSTLFRSLDLLRPVCSATCHCATIAFAFTNISYFAVKVNILYRSLIFFGHHVLFPHCFFGNNNTNRPDIQQKLQNGKRHFNAYFTNQCHHFYTYCPTDKKTS